VSIDTKKGRGDNVQNQIILKAENIEKSFPGTKALKKVSVELRKGEVHAVVGENGAGKSTLMNVISGVLPADSGEIILDNERLRLKNPNDARKAGIGLVHQELALCTHVTVSENVFIGRLPKKAGIVEQKKLYEMTKEVLEPFKTNIEPDQIVAELSVAQQQIVEIAKALSLNCKAVIFDEPTSSLNESEAQSLFEIIKEVTDKGIGVFYISHKLSEIFQICDRITILRDGALIKTVDTKSINADEVVADMVGKQLGNLYPEKSTCAVDGAEILRVENFTRFPYFKEVGFSLHKGEILGLCGLVGSGRTEVARAICGIDSKASGEVYLESEKISIKSYADALKFRICYLTEDRKFDGLFIDMDIKDNMIAPQLKKFSKYHLLNKSAIGELTTAYKEKLNIKFTAPEQKVSSLSGGNQQKIMIAKLLAVKPKVVIMDEPTRGIDVGAKAEVHKILRELSDSGIGVIVISSEMPEIVGVCDRVVIMNEGNVVSALKGDEVTQDKIIAEISEFNEQQECG